MSKSHQRTVAENEGQRYQVGMKIKQILILTVGITLVGLGSAVAASSDAHSYYVSLGSQNGYYIVRPDSQLRSKLGFEDAPYANPSDPLSHGDGAHALAFRFNRNGVLVTSPAYILAVKPNEFYTSRIGSLIRGRSKVSDVKALFGKPFSRTNRPDGFVLYYREPVHNPFEEDFS
jgi:hypothetical protein